MRPPGGAAPVLVAVRPESGLPARCSDCRSPAVRWMCVGGPDLVFELRGLCGVHVPGVPAPGGFGLPWLSRDEALVSLVMYA